MFAVAGSSQAVDGAFHFAAAIAAWGATHGLRRHRRSVAAAMLFHAVANITVSTFAIKRRTTLIATYTYAAALLFALLPRSPQRASKTIANDGHAVGMCPSLDSPSSAGPRFSVAGANCNRPKAQRCSSKQGASFGAETRYQLLRFEALWT
jgi:hypothetical protein